MLKAYTGYSSPQLTGLQEKIFLDRYADKELDPGRWREGDKVIAIVHEDAQNALLRETITGVTRTVLAGSLIVEDVSTGDMHEVPFTSVEYSREQEPQQMWDRVARALAGVEDPEKQQEVYEAFAYVLDDWKLVPGGRVNAGAGTDELTLMNCFVIASPHDSRGGIIYTLGEMTEIMSRGGGVGINLSTLRPKRAIVKGVRGHSSGSVSWGGLFSYTTGLVEQAGSRRGALMLMINDYHPDLMHFIRAKTQNGAITNANMSVCISNAFMEAVKFDRPWVLEFPITAYPAYNTEWDGDLKKWKGKGYPTQVFETLQARDIWDAIISSAWKSAEPGVVFMEYANQMSNSWYFNPLIATNPCGEQPLPSNGVCNLSAVNLSKFYDEAAHDVAWAALGRVVRIGVRLCDNVTTYTMYPLDGQATNQQDDERRSGLGTMGLAELMIKLKIRYGSPESLVFLDKLYGFMAKEAYLASADLASEKGPFGKFDADLFLASGFMQQMSGVYPEVITAVREKGMRNVTVLTQAPTGSTGTMVGTSTGIEPYFGFEYVRKGRLGAHTELVPIAAEWARDNPGKTLPPWFVTSSDLDAKDHVRVQAAIQRWTDSAISKTANAPNAFTVEQTKELYELAFDLGCKGVTIYRDGSRDIQVLETTKEVEKEQMQIGHEKAEETQNENDFESTKVCAISYDDQGNRNIECGTS